MREKPKPLDRLDEKNRPGRPDSPYNSQGVPKGLQDPYLKQMPKVPRVSEVTSNEALQGKVTMTKADLALKVLGFREFMLDNIRRAGFGIRVEGEKFDNEMEHVRCVLGLPENWKVQKSRFEREGENGKVQRIDEDLGIQEIVFDVRDHITQYNAGSTSSRADGVSEFEFQVVGLSDGEVTQYRFVRTE